MSDACKLPSPMMSFESADGQSHEIDFVEAGQVKSDLAVSEKTDQEFIESLGDWLNDKYQIKLSYGEVLALTHYLDQANAEFKKKLPTLQG